jgi:hypothetical protein
VIRVIREALLVLKTHGAYVLLAGALILWDKRRVFRDRSFGRKQLDWRSVRDFQPIGYVSN